MDRALRGNRLTKKPKMGKPSPSMTRRPREERDSLASISDNLVVISPYFTKPPPIATMAAISAAIPASWSFILNFFTILVYPSFC